MTTKKQRTVQVEELYYYCKFSAYGAYFETAGTEAVKVRSAVKAALDTLLREELVEFKGFSEPKWMPI